MTLFQTKCVSFLDSWPSPPKFLESDAEQQLGLTPLKKSQLQMILAINPFGIPSLAYEDAFFRVFSKKLNIRDMGFNHLAQMFSNLPDVFTIQMPDESTALLFPDFPDDYILHDARLGLTFSTIINPPQDPHVKNILAWLNRDCDFPEDVCLSGQTYKEFCYPMMKGNIPGTRGVTQVMIVSAASPDHLYVNVANQDLITLAQLSLEVDKYFSSSKHSKEMYLIPPEFIYFGFPCLAYASELGIWERSIILGLTKCRNFIVESVDFGGRRLVSYNNLRLIPNKFMKIPKQAVLVSLMGAKRRDNLKKWPESIGKRIRSFSNIHYCIDCLFVPLDRNCEESSLFAKVGTKYRNKKMDTPEYELLMCDRNDPLLDLHLDKVLIMETYADPDRERVEIIENLREQFVDVLKTIPRPQFFEKLKLDEVESSFPQVVDLQSSLSSSTFAVNQE